MKTFLFSIYDKKVGAYMPIFFARSKGEAVRMISDAIDDPKSTFHKHAEDYMLSMVGSFDDANGSVLSSLEPVINLLELKKPV